MSIPKAIVRKLLYEPLLLILGVGTGMFLVLIILGALAFTGLAAMFGKSSLTLWGDRAVRVAVPGEG